LLPKLLAAKSFLDEEREFIVYHGTRRKEPIEHLKKYGFCSYNLAQAEEWLEQEMEKAIKSGQLLFNGKRIRERVEELKRMVREPGRMLFSVTAIEEDVPGWADRNPEFIYDLLAGRLPKEKVREFLREKFGPPLKVILKLKLPVRKVMGIPQDIHTDLYCFTPEQIIDIQPLED